MESISVFCIAGHFTSFCVVLAYIYIYLAYWVVCLLVCFDFHFSGFWWRLEREKTEKRKGEREREHKVWWVGKLRGSGIQENLIKYTA